jgi:hypothetical protein
LIANATNLWCLSCTCLFWGVYGWLWCGVHSKAVNYPRHMGTRSRWVD